MLIFWTVRQIGTNGAVRNYELLLGAHAWMSYPPVSRLSMRRFPGPRSKLASVALRLFNNFFGAHAWMACAKALNLDRPRAVKQHKRADRYLEPESGAISLQ